MTSPYPDFTFSIGHTSGIGVVAQYVIPTVLVRDIVHDAIFNVIEWITIRVPSGKELIVKTSLKYNHNKHNKIGSKKLEV